MNEQGYIDYSQLAEEKLKIIRDPNFELTSELSAEELQIITNMIKEKKILDVEILKQFKFLSKSKFKKIQKKIEFDFGHTIDFEEKDGKIVLKIDGKIIDVLGENASQTMISNGMGDTTFVKATGIVKKEIWEKKKVEKDIKKIIASGFLVLLIILPILGRSCGKVNQEIGNSTENDIVSNDDVNNNSTITQIQDLSIDGTTIIEYFNNIFSTVASDMRMLEDQHLSYEEDLRVLQSGHATDYSQISSEVKVGATFLQEVQAFQQKYPVGTNFDAEQLESYLVQAKLLLENYHGLLLKTRDYCQQHLSSNTERISRGLLSSVDLNAEGVITSQQYGEIETKVNIVNSALQITPQFSSLVELVESGKISFMEDGKILYHTEDDKIIYYESLESFISHNANVFDGQMKRGI